MANSARPRLFGRSAELAALEGLVDAAAAGAGGGLLLVGEPGVGKSRLVDATGDLARGLGFDVLIGRARQHEIPRPLASVLDALGLRTSDVLGPADHSRTLLEAGAAGATGFLVADRLLEAIEARCSLQPVLLVLEDLHWAEHSTISWLADIVVRSASQPLAVVGTTRPPQSHSPLRRTVDQLGIARLSIAALGAHDVHALAAHTLSGEPGPRLLDELDSAGGNPLLLLALLEALSSSNVLRYGQDQVELLDRGRLRPDGPIAAQVAELDGASLSVVQLAAVMGMSFGLDDLATVLGRRTVELMSHLDLAVLAGIISSSGPRYSFFHELHREAVLATLPAAALGPIHLDIARALAAVEAPALDVAEHFAQGARPGNREAVAWLQRAAVEIVDHSPGVAMRLLDIALSLCGSTPSHALLLARVRALSGAGHTADAEALGRSLLREGLDPANKARLHRELGFAYFIEGRAAEAATEIEEYARLITDDSLRGRAAAELAFTRFVNLDHPGARTSADFAVGEGRRTGDLAAQVGGGGVLSWLALFGCDFSAADRWANTITTLAEQPHAADAQLYQPWLIAGLVWLEIDDLDRSQRAARRGQELANIHGAAWAIPAYDAIAAFIAFRRGDFDDATAAAAAALGYLDGADGFGVAVWCNSFLALIALHRGDEETAEHHIAIGEDWCVRGRAQFGIELCMLARARLHVVRNEPSEAARVLTDAWHLCSGLGLDAARQALAPDLVRLAVQVGDRELAAAVAAGALSGAEAAGTPAFGALAALAVAHLTADVERALEAVALARRTQRRPLIATALGDAAQLCRLQGKLSSATRLAHEAAELWSSMGAYAEAETAAVTAGGRSPVRRPRFGFDALTGTERRVAALITEGLSNVGVADRLCVSRRTVESHVSSAYRKLGVSSRVELARIMLDHEAAERITAEKV